MQSIYINKVTKKVAIIMLPLFLLSCNKLIEIDAPPSYVSEVNVYSSDETAISVLTGIYTIMSSSSSIFTGNQGISLRTGLSSDEFMLSNKVTDVKLLSYYQNALTVNSSPGAGFESWEPLYKLIFYCNSALEGLQVSTSLTASIKQQLIGEAKFVRAFCYFYLINNFGDVPLATTTDYKVNTSIPRRAQSEVYSQIIADLLDAQVFLSGDYLNGSLKAYSGTPERVRPTKWAATALLARVYLYINDYSNAEAQASIILNNKSLFGLSSIAETFLKNNSEAIWQLQPTASGWNTEDARVFVINRAQGNSKPVYLDQKLLNAFETGDARKNNWVKDTTISSVKYFYPYKYKSAVLNSPVTEYFMVLRLGEQYLIRSEARAQLNNISGALIDLNALRKRAALSDTVADDKTSLLAVIMHERRVELFAELGHRWYDLKRTNSLNAVMTVATPLKGGEWEATDQLYPLPLSEIERNTELVQNNGY